MYIISRGAESILGHIKGHTAQRGRVGVPQSHRFLVGVADAADTPEGARSLFCCSKLVFVSY